MSTMLGVSITTAEEIATYLKLLIHKELHGQQEEIPIPTFSIDLLEECHYAVKQLVQAAKNTKKMSWSAKDYVAEVGRRYKRCRGRNDAMEAELLFLFPAGKEEFVSSPCVVVDVDGRILLWYLPGILDRGRRNIIWESLSILEETLVIKPGGTNWRDSTTYFHQGQSYQYKAGTVSFALAWFQQARQNDLPMEVGAGLRKLSGPAWVNAMGQTSAFLGGVMGVMHPETFASGMECVKAIGESSSIAKQENLDDLMKIWSSPYTTVSLMSNRDSPLHRDTGATYTCMDLLASVGQYKCGEFQVPGLGLKLWYTPGTLIGLLGRVVRHGATSSGDRLCFAQYLRESVLDALGIQHPDWVKIQDLAAL